MWKRIVDAWNGVTEPQCTEYDFAEMQRLVREKPAGIVLVDVREPDEFASVSIPGSINVPWNSHRNAFELSDAEFERLFAAKKPAKDDKLVFYCAAGLRGAQAREAAEKLGYTNNALYRGSMNDWVAHGAHRQDY